MTKNLPLSVLIPAYNYGRFIGEAIESVLSQSFGDFELIVIDNASTDNTRDILGTYTDERIRVIINPRNMGPHYSGGLFLKEARGKYLRVLCADDVLIADVLAEQVRALERYHTLGLVTCDYLTVDESLQGSGHTRVYPGFTGGRYVKEQSLHTLQNLVGGPSNYMFRNSALLRDYEFDPTYKYLGDLKFGLLLLQGKDFLNIDRPGYYYRQHAGSETNLNLHAELQADEWFRLTLENCELCHVNCLLLLQRALPAKRKLYLMGWLSKHLLDRECLSKSYRARRTLGIQCESM